MAKACFRIPEHLKHILRKPVPGLSVDGLWQRLLPVADEGVAWQEVWAQVQANTSAEDRQAHGIMLVTGTSGVGKTKVAHDIGMRCALVVLAPASTYDAFTHPYRLLMERLERMEEQMLSERKVAWASTNPAVAMFCHLLVSYVEWAAEVIETAMAMQCPRANLRAVLLLAQNTKDADLAVTYLFNQALSSCEMTYSAARARLATAVSRCRGCWSNQPILMCHDEVQAILMKNQTFRRVFDEKTGGFDGKVRGFFYGFTKAIRELLVQQDVEHMLCGTNLRLTTHVMNDFSPAQGLSKHVSLATSLTSQQIKSWFAEYLTPEAAAALDDNAVGLLRGRPLFAAGFFKSLVEQHSAHLTAADAVRSALQEAYSIATVAAFERAQALWNRADTSPLLAALYASLKLGLGTIFKCLLPAQPIVAEAIFAGVFNIPVAELSDSIIDLGAEPLTAIALCEVGDRDTARTDWSHDKAAVALGLPWIGLAGCRSAKGEVLERFFVWHVIKMCLKQSTVTLKDLLSEFVDEAYLPAGMDRYTVRAKMAIRCHSQGGAFLGLFSKHRDAVILHDTPTAGGCADIAFLVAADLNKLADSKEANELLNFPDGSVGSTESDELRLVIVQAKNREESGLPAAMRSLDMGTWFPDHPRASEQSKAHEAFLAQFKTHPSWFSEPIRIVLHRKHFQRPLLDTVAALNTQLFPQQPVILATAPCHFHLKKASNIGMPKNLRATFMPHRVRDWPADVSHPQDYLPEQEEAQWEDEQT